MRRMKNPEPGSEKPWPYIKFRTKKIFRKNSLEEVEPQESVCFLNVDGCHNSIESINNLMKDGLMPIGYGNLLSNKFGEILAYLRPIMAAVSGGTTPLKVSEAIPALDQKLDEAKKRLQQR